MIDVAVARRFAPEGTTIVPVWPGKTLGAIAFASYEAGSTLVYRELIVVAGLVRAGRRIGACIPRLYVDSAASVAGGRDLWLLPKRLAEFALSGTAARPVVSVRERANEVVNEVVRLEFASHSGGLPLALPLPAFGARDGRLAFFIGCLRARLAPSRVRVRCAESIFAAPGAPRFSFAFTLAALRLWVPRAAHGAEH